MITQRLGDREQAVLYALESHNHVSSARLFAALPHALREQWTERYLADTVLRELIRADYVGTRQVGPGLVHYWLTPKGKLRLR